MASALSPRLLEQIDRTADCWLWRGGVDRQGYGRFGGRIVHRLIYEALVAPIPEGLELDHLCDAPACCRPEHLEAVTRLENMRRRVARRTHCKNGHPFTPENTYSRPEGRFGFRRCRACNRAQATAYRARQGAAS